MRGGDCADPAYGTWDHAGFEGVCWEVVRVDAWTVEHDDGDGGGGWKWINLFFSPSLSDAFVFNLISFVPQLSF